MLDNEILSIKVHKKTLPKRAPYLSTSTSTTLRSRTECAPENYGRFATNTEKKGGNTWSLLLQKVDEEPWNNGTQEKCTVCTRLTATVEDCIRGKKRGRNGDEGDCVQERGPWRYDISDLKWDFFDVPSAEKGGSTGLRSGIIFGSSLAINCSSSWSQPLQRTISADTPSF